MIIYSPTGKEIKPRPGQIISVGSMVLEYGKWITVDTPSVFERKVIKHDFCQSVEVEEYLRPVKTNPK